MSAECWVVLQFRDRAPTTAHLLREGSAPPGWDYRYSSICGLAMSNQEPREAPEMPRCRLCAKQASR